MDSKSELPPYVTPVREALEPDVLRALRRDVRALREAAVSHERLWSAELADVAAVHRSSARNLIHYLSLRQSDARDVQAALAWVGLSSLGRAESHVLVTLDRIEGLLALALGEPLPEADDRLPPVGFREGCLHLERNTRTLFGEGRETRPVRIMVTLPDAAASNPGLVENLVAAGMDCARINLARGDREMWRQMVENVRRAGRARVRDVTVMMDLAGPKIRTGRVAGDQPTRVRKGDVIVLVRELDDYAAPAGASPRAIVEAGLDLFLPSLAVGDTVLIDDGKITTRVVGLSDGYVQLEVTKAKKKKGSKLKARRGINIPGRSLRIPALTESDLGLLGFAAEYADSVSLSFVRYPEDVDALIDAIAATGHRELGIVLKIETREAFENLPRLLLRGMRTSVVGVMIARGDLAAEIGFERLAEAQEGILWIAEAAHVPTVWATQVLEELAKSGTPSRAEVTDAAMGVRAEAVMLNKGPEILDAVRMLDDILRRMQRHQFKKVSLLSPLRDSWQERAAHSVSEHRPRAPAGRR